jgi:L-alanine-DL-glutamate epimerase-like enolase superfamily enzyme
MNAPAPARGAISSAAIGDVRAHAFTIPTDAPEGDGTYRWDKTTLLLVEVDAGSATGIGYSYTSASAAQLVREMLAGVVRGRDAFDIRAAFNALQQSVRNLGRDGIAATAISALDTALWDVKARLLGLPLALLFGRARDRVEIYGSGGFTTYSDAQLRDQMRDFVEKDGCRFAKMKIGADPAHDPHRMRVAHEAIGDARLMVDANGAFAVRQALALAETDLVDEDVVWFEEPVSSDDLAGLALMRARAPGHIEIAAGEYGYDADYFRRMLEAGAVDVLQADVTRCGGYTGFLEAAALCDAHHIDLSGHCAPALHLPVGCAAPRFGRLEWFHDHVRIEHMLFDGAPNPKDGFIAPDLSRPGHGLAFRFADAERYRVA